MITKYQIVDLHILMKMQVVLQYCCSKVGQLKQISACGISAYTCMPTLQFHLSNNIKYFGSTTLSCIKLSPAVN